MCETASSDARNLQLVKELFRSNDTNRDGKLDCQELCELLTRLNRSLTAKDCEKLFAAADKDGDGFLEFDEFVDFLDTDGGAPLHRASCVEAKDPYVPVEVLVPPIHKGFQLGGKHGNIVTRVSDSQTKVLLNILAECCAEVVMKRGWRITGLNGRDVSAKDVLSKCAEARSGRQYYTLMVEIAPSDDILHRLGKHASLQALARKQLIDMCDGARTLQEFEELDADKKRELLQSCEALRLLVQSRSVMELDVLLGLKPAGLLQHTVDISQAAKLGDAGVVGHLLHSVAQEERADVLLQRDGLGNVPLHYAKGVEVVRVLLHAASSTRNLMNAEKSTPLLTQLRRTPDDVEASKLLAVSACDYLQLNTHNMCPAMYATKDIRKKLTSMIASWQEVSSALSSEPAEMAATLTALQPGEGTWDGLLIYHVYGEECVWKEGSHSKLSLGRLDIIWRALKRSLKAFSAHDGKAETACRMLLKVLRGPFHPKLYPVEPCHDEWAILMLGLEQKSERCMNKCYAQATEQSGAEQLSAVTNKSPGRGIDAREQWETWGLEPKPRMWLHVPEWVSKACVKAIHEDLVQLKEIGNIDRRDASYDLMTLTTQSQSLYSQNLTVEDMAVASWYAAWQRGICQKWLDQTASAVRAVVGSTTYVKFSARSEAKGFARTCEKMMQYLSEVVLELDSNYRDESENIRMFLRTAASLVVDVIGCTVVVESVEDLMAVYAKLTEGSASKADDEIRIVRCMRVKNGFRSDAGGGYRDVKVWLEIECPSGHLVVEVQLLLRSMFEEKQWSHLPYEVRRGSFTWPHVGAKMADRYSAILEQANELMDLAKAADFKSVFNLLDAWEPDVAQVLINFKDSHRNNYLLHKAAEWGENWAVEKLLSLKADLTLESNDGYTAIYYARLHGSTDCVDTLQKAEQSLQEEAVLQEA